MPEGILKEFLQLNLLPFSKRKKGREGMEWASEAFS